MAGPPSAFPGQGARPPIAARRHEPCAANETAPARWRARPRPVSDTLEGNLIPHDYRQRNKVELAALRCAHGPRFTVAG